MGKQKAIIASLGFATILIGGGTTAYLMNVEKPGSGNNAEPQISAQAKNNALTKNVEYGTNLTNKTFTVNAASKSTAVKYTDLKPALNAKKLGVTKHTVKANGEKFNVTIKVADTKKPVITGAKNMTFKYGTDVKKEIKKRVKAKDSVDGSRPIKLTLKTVKDKKRQYVATVVAVDKNGNKTTKKFSVKVLAKGQKMPAVAKKPTAKKSTAKKSTVKKSTTSSSVKSKTTAQKKAAAVAEAKKKAAFDKKKAAEKKAVAAAEAKKKAEKLAALKKAEKAEAAAKKKAESNNSKLTQEQIIANANKEIEEQVKKDKTAAKAKASQNIYSASTHHAYELKRQKIILAEKKKSAARLKKMKAKSKNGVITIGPKVKQNANIKNAIIKDRDPYFVDYQYKKNLRNGAKIKLVTVYGEFTGAYTVAIEGIDEKGKQFYGTSTNFSKVLYMFSNPSLGTKNSIDIQRVADEFYKKGTY